MIGIYKITSPTNKIYIGSSIDIQKRIKHYNSISCKRQTKLYNSIKKYGWEKHSLEILIECKASKLYFFESYYGDLYNVLGSNGLNLILPKSNDIKIGVSEETRIKMSKSKLGSKNTFFGKKHSQETKNIISKIHKGTKHTLEHRMKVSKNNGRGMSKNVLDLNMGIFYNSAKEVSEIFNISHSTLKSRLNGNRKNTTQFIYC
jgi:group I intron endonuclease